jgi:threonine synthase
VHEFLRVFATDLPPDTLRGIVAASYTKFGEAEIATAPAPGEKPVRARALPRPDARVQGFRPAAARQPLRAPVQGAGEEINMLGATSGDTGAAAIHGLLGKPGTAIFILYPDGRVSPLQERQMTCTGADNVHAIAVDGTFDDAQAR